MAKTHHRTQDDKILHLYYSAVDYFEKNTTRVYTILAVIVAAGLLVYFYMNNQKNKTAEADAELSNATTVYEAGAYDQAINGDSLGLSKGLLYIVNEYGSTSSGEVAKIMLANSYYYIRDFANAEKYYNDYSGNDEILKAAAIAGIGAVLEARNDFSGAAKQYEKAAGINKLLAANDEYLFYAARDYSLANDKENYERVASQLKADYPKSTYIARLDRYKL